MKKIIIFIIFITLGISTFVALKSRGVSFKDADLIKNEEKVVVKEQAKEESGDNSDSLVEPVQSEAKEKIEEKTIIREVPFMSQAPSGKWSDPTFQNGCEEASMIMAMSWITGKSFDVGEAESEMQKLTDFEQELLGKNVDTSLVDTANLFKKYYKFEKVYPLENATKDAIVSELQKGNILLAPVYGRDLKNPNFTSPGPITHMLVIIGYDNDKKQFITNDPGTRRGKAFRYDENILYDAIWMYETSNDHDQLPSTVRNKGMIVIEK